MKLLNNGNYGELIFEHSDKNDFYPDEFIADFISANEKKVIINLRFLYVICSSNILFLNKVLDYCSVFDAKVFILATAWQKDILEKIYSREVPVFDDFRELEIFLDESVCGEEKDMLWGEI